MPGPRRLRPGDVVKVDVGVVYEGCHTDCARTYVVADGTSDGAVDGAGGGTSDGTADGAGTEVNRLIAAARTALWAGVRAARCQAPVSDISHAVHRCALAHGATVIKHAFGHGIGRMLHQAPQIPNFGPPGMGPRLRAGMAIAIEPLLTTGCGRTRTKDDGWTEVTTDGAVAVHFEDTVLITEDGPQVLTGHPPDAALGQALPPLPGLRLRPMRPDERGWALTLAHQEMDPVLLRAWGRRVEVEEIFAIPGARWCIVEVQGGKPAGFLVVVPRLGDALFVNTLVLDRSYQGCGIGRWVMTQVEAWARAEGASAVELWVQIDNPRAVRFYRRLGFAVVGEPALRTLAMRKRMEPDRSAFGDRPPADPPSARPSPAHGPALL